MRSGTPTGTPAEKTGGTSGGKSGGTPAADLRGQLQEKERKPRFNSQSDAAAVAFRHHCAEVIS
jgi:hypothetical protein